MSFTQFIKPYPDGYEDFEVGGTPVTAEILNTNYDGFLLGLNEFLPELAGMVEANPSESATAGNLTKLKVGNSIYLIPSGGSGGSTVEWEQLQLTGTKIATITIDNVPVDVYAPSGGGSGDEVSWNQVLGSGTEIGTITINGTPITVYAPTPINVEANPSGSATAGDLTKLKVGSSIYSIPSGGASDLSDLGDVSITNVQNGQIIKWNSTTSKWENSNESGGGTGGHTIIDENDNSMTARAGLQFFGAVEVTDDSANNRTLVEVLGGDFYNPVIYSTEEREIGVWTDGKPLYEKTWDFGSDIVCTSNSWTDTPIAKGDIEKIVDIKAVNNAGTIWDMLGANTDQTYVQVYHNRGSNNAISIRYATLQYTKTTDVAGSGSWTPQGVPAVHYSTDEQVVGTWMGETLYEKTINSTVALSNSWTDYFDMSNKNLVDVSKIRVKRDGEWASATFSPYQIVSYIVRNNYLKFCIQSTTTPDPYVLYSATIQYTKSS